MKYNWDTATKSPEGEIIQNATEKYNNGSIKECTKTDPKDAKILPFM